MFKNLGQKKFIEFNCKNECVAIGIKNECAAFLLQKSNCNVSGPKSQYSIIPIQKT
jgi:hypothetical protein